MRSLRTSIILAALAALLLGFILWFERGSLTSGELEKRKSSAIPELVRERVSRLEIQRAGTTTVLVRELHDEDGDEPEIWRVEAPYRASADRDAVDTLLGELEFLDARRRLEDISADDRKRFGFEQPRYRLWFTVGDRRESILVGNESPRGDGVYVQAADPRLAFVASKDLLETLAQEPAHYHTKELHAGATMSGAIELSLSDAEGERAVRKQADGSWTLVRPALGLASEPAISEVIQAFDGLRAKHFVEANAKSLGGYGLDKPRFELSLRAVSTGGTQSETRLRVGGACSPHPGESHVTIDGHEISCVLDEDLAKLRKPLAALREARMLPWDDDAIASLQLDRGDRSLRLARTDAGWSYTALRAGKSVGQGEARPEAVSDWLAALRGAKAAEWHPGGLGPLRPADAIALSIARKDKPRYELRIDATKRPLVAQRGTEPERAMFSESILDRLTPNAARFQKLDLIHVAATAFRQIEIRRQNQVERLVSADGKTFRIEAPIKSEADTIRVSELTRLIGALEAARFVADEPDASHGLTNPQVVFAAEYEDDPKSSRKQIGLRIGAATDGGCFAQLDGQPGVFVVASQLAQLLSEPFVSRTALAVPLEAIAAIDIEHAGKKLHLERSGEQIVATDPSLPPGRAQAIAEAIATLRASSATSYGPPTAAHGLQKPYARISIALTSAEGRRTIALGNESHGGRYARSDDSPVVFTLPAKLTTTLLPNVSGPRPGLAAHR
jgi:TolB-like protein